MTHPTKVFRIAVLPGDGIGVEPPSVADVNALDELTRIHKILLQAGVTIVEGLTNLESLTQQRVFFVAAPLKLESGDGAPCRAFAIEDDDDSVPAAGSLFT